MSRYPEVSNPFGAHITEVISANNFHRCGFRIGGNFYDIPLKDGLRVALSVDDKPCLDFDRRQVSCVSTAVLCPEVDCPVWRKIAVNISEREGCLSDAKLRQVRVVDALYDVVKRWVILANINVVDFEGQCDCIPAIAILFRHDLCLSNAK